MRCSRLLALVSCFCFTVNASSLVSLNIQQHGNILLIPFTAGELSVSSQLSLEGYPTAKFSSLAKWPTSEGAAKFVRMLVIELDTEVANGSRDLFWKDASRPLQASLDFDSGEAVLVFDKERLKRSVLLHPESANDEWYLLPQSKKASYIVDTKKLEAANYPMTAASQWLYDRPQSLFQLSFMTGESSWSEHASDLSRFTIEHVSAEGYLDLVKRKDPKYLLPRGLWYYYLSSGDKNARRAIVRIFNASLNWEPAYDLDRGFWTERNQAAALNAAVVYWEMTNSQKALQRIKLILDQSSKMVFEPSGDWPYRGCMQHSFKSHEGDAGDSAVCSPWMSAIFVEALWRYYYLSMDPDAKKLLSVFSQLIDDSGTYRGNERVKNKLIPFYLVAFDDPSLVEKNQWTDPQHSCDVLAMYLRSIFLNKKEQGFGQAQQDTAIEFLNSCNSSYAKALSTNRTVWVLKPPRSFAWTYSSTSDLPWLVEELLPSWQAK